MSDVETRRRRTREILAEISERDVESIKESDRLREDLGLDSLQSLELLSVVSEELRINLPMEDAMELRTVGDACDFVEHSWEVAQKDGAPPRREESGERA